MARFFSTVSTIANVLRMIDSSGLMMSRPEPASASPVCCGSRASARSHWNAPAIGVADALQRHVVHFLGERLVAAPG
jgi:hypothetical protein